MPFRRQRLRTGALSVTGDRHIYTLCEAAILVRNAIETADECFICRTGTVDAGTRSLTGDFISRAEQSAASARILHAIRRTDLDAIRGTGTENTTYRTRPQYSEQHKRKDLYVYVSSASQPHRTRRLADIAPGRMPAS